MTKKSNTRRKDKQRMQQAEANTVAIENPYFGPTSPTEQRFLKVEVTHVQDLTELKFPISATGQPLPVKATRNDTIARMLSRKTITDSMYRAAMAYRGLWAASEVSGLRTIDWTETPVSGGRSPSGGLSERQRRAMDEKARIHGSLGRQGTQIVELVVINNKELKEVMVILGGFRSSREYNFIGRRFRECMDTLVEEFGLSTKRKDHAKPT